MNNGEGLSLAKLGGGTQKQTPVLSAEKKAMISKLGLGNPAQYSSRNGQLVVVEYFPYEVIALETGPYFLERAEKSLNDFGLTADSFEKTPGFANIFMWTPPTDKVRKMNLMRCALYNLYGVSMNRSKAAFFFKMPSPAGVFSREFFDVQKKQEAEREKFPLQYPECFPELKNAVDKLRAIKGWENADLGALFKGKRPPLYTVPSGNYGTSSTNLSEVISALADILSGVPMAEVARRHRRSVSTFGSVFSIGESPFTGAVLAQVKEAMKNKQKN